MNCPVCGHPDGACKGSTRTNERQVITSAGTQKRVGPERMPAPGGAARWRNRVGYVGQADGRVEVYDQAYPHITFVSGEESEADGEVSPPDVAGGEGAALFGDAGAAPATHTAESGGVLPAAEEEGASSVPPKEDDAPRTPRRTRRKKADE